MSDFQSLSRSAMASFLQHVVVVDDRAYKEKDDTPKPDLTAPGRGDARPKPNKELISVSAPEHRLRTKILVESFADFGLVCSVLEPDQNSNNDSIVLKVAQRADIVVLDWKIHETYGEITLGLINRILKDDSSDRLRLFAIYTGENDLFKIADAVKGLFKPDDIINRNDGLLFSAGPVTVTILAKEDTKVNPEFKNRVIKEENLPTKLILEFSQTTSGLMANVVLEAFAAIRSNAHSILSKFPPEMDAPYVAHRILSDPPEEAESHVVPLVMAEIENVVGGDNKVNHHLKTCNIYKWLHNKLRFGDHSCYLDVPLCGDMKLRYAARFYVHHLMKLVKNGIEHQYSEKDPPNLQALIKSIKNNNKNLSELTGLFCANGQRELLDRDFAVLTSVKSVYGSTAPTLRLGSIIAKVSSSKQFKKVDSYLLCIQPVCDSVRLDGTGRVFPFLKLIEKTKPKHKIFAVLPHGDGHLELVLSLKSYDLSLIKFKPSSSGKPIVAQKSEMKWYFDAGEEDVKYQWLADLKTAQAQRVANDFAREVSRVGLTESDWLRRMAK
ncbi:hypothetical protein SAMN04488082_11916 [Desulfomicrobium apsheronum]|uniref:Response receiver domain-containing protein n=1 Tax=Desulfomicrobium apsheronum TaxID=52560 RepID=A0A1I3Y7J6_9BACT|nr:response regulator receiver domain [Desulfomicrobium apsheronum]SFK27795.1 hypothetical protein SAMN04488082_11916 [Desulfomicrobium apsheronum]